MEWRIAVGYPDYAVSENGDVLRVAPDRYNREPSGKPQSQQEGKKGYKHVSMSVDGKAKTVRIHRIVAVTFIGPQPTSRRIVAHYDGNPSNNHRSNLRWAMRTENWDDALRHGTATIGEKQGNSKLTEDQVRGIKRELRSENCRTKTAIALEHGVTVQAIWLIDRGRNWPQVDLDENGVVGVAKPRRATFLR